MIALAAGVGAAACYPAAVLATRWNGLEALTLDGWAYLERDRPDDLAAIRWLRESAVGQPVVLETTGNPYSDYARVSSNTGLPTVLGWANHEGVWRGNDARIGERREAVAEIYETPDAERALELLRRYEVRYVFVGELEHRDYGTEGLEKFASHPDRFEIAFRSGETVVYEVR